jgi:hypothetical protein
MNTLGRSGQKPWLPNRVGSREYEGTSPVLRRYRGTKIQSRKFNLIGKGKSEITRSAAPESGRAPAAACAPANPLRLASALSQSNSSACPKVYHPNS